MAVVILILLHVLGKVEPRYAYILPTMKIDMAVAISVLPVSLTFMGMVCLNSWFLMSVGVGFYAIGKSLAIPFSVVLSFVVLKQNSSGMTLFACFLVIFGVFVSSYFKTQMEWQGLLLGSLCSLFTAAYQIAVKRGLNAMGGDQWKLSYYNSVWVVLVLTPIAFVSGEGDGAMKMLFSGGDLNTPLVAALFLSGVVGFTIGQATYMSIHYTSALAHHVTGAAKSCLQTLLGILIWGEAATFSGVAGLLLSLGGSFVFMRSRMKKPEIVPVREEQV